MPTFNFRNKESGKEISIFMSMSEREELLVDHPHLEQLPPSSVQIGDSVLLGIQKPGGAFRERLVDIKKSHIRSNINTR